MVSGTKDPIGSLDPSCQPAARNGRGQELSSQSGWQLYDLPKDGGEKSDLAAEFAEKKTEPAKMWEPWDSHNIAPRWHESLTEDL